MTLGLLLVLAGLAVAVFAHRTVGLLLVVAGALLLLVSATGVAS